MAAATIILALAAGLPVRQPPVLLEGCVVNGTRSDTPAARTEVVLRAGRGNNLQQIAKTVTDAAGRFAFRDLSIDASLVYVAGANHCGVHYPGPRFLLEPGRAAAPLTLTVYDTVTAPSPLVAEKYQIDIDVQPTLLEITESLSIQNPTLATFVGEADQDGFAETLRLAIPNSFERVTFHQEFFGRRFKVGDKCVVTDIPWTPGKREVKFTYRIPRQSSWPSFERIVDLPCSEVRLRVVGDDLPSADCNLPRVEGRSDLVFASAGKQLALGAAIRLRLGGVGAAWYASARGIGLLALAALVLATAFLAGRRRSAKRVRPASQNGQSSQDGREEKSIAA